MGGSWSTNERCAVSGVALVTGGTKRVGAAIAQRLAARGLTVIATSRTSGGEHGLTAAPSVRSLLCDCTTDEGMDTMVRAVGPSLRVLVHNASVYERTPFGSITRDAVERSMAVHAVGPLLLTQALAPALERGVREHGDASVVAMLDIHADGRPRAERAAYLAGKGALRTLIEALAIDAAPIRVNGVAPGVVGWDAQAAPDERTAYESRIPLARAGTPADAAGVVEWLALDATYVTGSIVRVDGGRALR